MIHDTSTTQEFVNHYIQHDAIHYLVLVVSLHYRHYTILLSSYIIIRTVK